jgi:hypothetical protein
VNLGSTFLLKTAIEKHIWFAIHVQKDLAVILNFTTYNPDPTCTITCQEYPTLHHDSSVAYQHGKLLNKKQIEILEKHGILRFLDPLPESVIKKIQQGAIASQFTPEKIKNVLAPPPKKASPPKSN